MTLEIWNKQLKESKAQLERLLDERDRIDAQIASLRTVITGLARLTGHDIADEIFKHMGLTTTVRTALRMAGKPLTPPEIRELVRDLGYDIRSQSNILASIHTTVKRLVDSGEARVVTLPDGNTAYERVRTRFPRLRRRRRKVPLSTLAGTKEKKE